MLEPTPPVALISSSPPHTPIPHACSPQPFVFVSGISLSATSVPAFAVPVALVGVTVKLSCPLPSSPNVPITPVPATPLAITSDCGISAPIVPVPAILVDMTSVSGVDVPIAPVPSEPPFGNSKILSCVIDSVPVAPVA